MSTYLKYNATGTESNSLFRGNWAISRQLQSGFDIHVEVPYGGFTMINPGSPPVIRSVANETEFVELIQKMGGPKYDLNYINDGSISTTVGACMRWLETKYPNMLILNKDYEEIITNNLEFMFDPNYLPSFSRYEAVGRDVSKNRLTSNLGLANNIQPNLGNQIRASVYDSHAEAWYNIKQACQTAGFSDLSGILVNDQDIYFYELPTAPFEYASGFEWTIEAWVSYPYGSSNYNGPAITFDVGNMSSAGPSTGHITNLRLDRNAGKCYHRRYWPQIENGVITNVNSEDIAFGNTSITDQPIHIVFTSDGWQWINGQRTEHQTILTQGGWVDNDGISQLRIIPQQSLRSGCILHNLRVYSNALTIPEIQQNFDAQKGLYGKSGVTFSG